MSKLSLDVSDFIHANEHTKRANSGLDVNFWNFLLMPFYFMIKKDSFKQKLLLWAQVPFKFLHKFFQNATKILNIIENSYLTNNTNEILDPVDKATFEYKNHPSILKILSVLSILTV